MRCWNGALMAPREQFLCIGLLSLLPAPFSTKSGAGSPTGALPSPGNIKNKKKKSKVFVLSCGLEVEAQPSLTCWRGVLPSPVTPETARGAQRGTCRKISVNPPLVELQTGQGWEREGDPSLSAPFLSRIFRFTRQPNASCLPSGVLSRA